MLRKKSFFWVALLCTYSSFAQDSLKQAEAEKPAPLVSGYVDAYYRYNFSNPPRDLEQFNNFTSFTNSQNSFELGMASVRLDHTFKKVGLVVDLGFGKRAEEFSYADAATRFAVKQAYVSFAPKENLKLTAGSWATHVGYELVDPYLNRNYSMSYLFSYGPFSHTGIKAEYFLGKSGFMLGVANPSDLKSASFSRKFLIGQYSVSTMEDKLKFYLNYQGGSADRLTRMKQFDAVVSGTLSDVFSIGYNGTIQYVRTKGLDGKFGEASKWWGSALYLNADPASWFGLTLRGEYFDNSEGVVAAPGASIFETTLSANFKIEGLTIIPELRLDKASKEIFTGSDGSTRKNTLTGLLAAVYKF